MLGYLIILFMSIGLMCSIALLSTRDWYVPLVGALCLTGIIYEVCGIISKDATTVHGRTTKLTENLKRKERDAES